MGKATVAGSPGYSALTTVNISPRRVFRGAGEQESTLLAVDFHIHNQC